MMPALPIRILAPLALLLLSGCVGTPWTQSPVGPETPRLRFLGYAEMPAQTLDQAGLPGVPLGGISGLDYDPARELWYLLSDDRSEHGPARLLTARIGIGPGGVGEIALLQALPLRQPDGATFPPPRQGKRAVDPEAIRFDPATGTLLWASEGDPADGFGPSLFRAAPDGGWIGEVPLPPMLSWDPDGKTGPRPNQSAEGLGLAVDGGLWLAMEAPLAQDGPPASPGHGALARFSRLTPDGRLLAQIAYPLDPIPHQTQGRFADNGVSEILPLAADRLLVLERAGIQAADGHFDFHNRLYLADLRDATDAATVASLQDRSDIIPVRKQLLLDFATLALGVPVDNLEAMAFGPSLPNGAKSLLVAADNNFNGRERNQFLLFALE